MENNITRELQQAQDELTTLKTKYGTVRFCRNSSAASSIFSMGFMFATGALIAHFDNLNIIRISSVNVIAHSALGFIAGMQLSSFVSDQVDLHILKKDIKNKEEEVNQKVLTLSNSQTHEIK